MNKVGILLIFSLTLGGVFALGQTPAASPVASPSVTPSPTPKPSAAAIPEVPAGNSVTFETAYNSGIQFYAAKDFEKARVAFTQAVDKEPHNASALTNLALVQYKLNHKALAIGLLRKSLETDPNQATAQAALKFALSQMEIKEIPHQLETYETLRTELLQPITLNLYLFITALFLFAAGWTLLNFAGKRRRALQEEDRLPSFPLIGSLFAVGFVIFLVLSSLKYYDGTLPRGTIVENEVTVQAAPGLNQVSLFTLHGGFEVLIRAEQPDWIQVTYPGASTGWIPKSSLMITTH